ncbi:hypothetical protein CEXT_398891 [Caerostris extrusa]|uniref:Uncharacterized protein n=1 Tax=Caerostris extrusa TaxID=172846 RepID=A0AAV4TUG3_CAEEX|nr:hypothetical protein CEXT_398891 [Caerostris extrusa]
MLSSASEQLEERWRRLLSGSSLTNACLRVCHYAIATCLGRISSILNIQTTGQKRHENRLRSPRLTTTAIDHFWRWSGGRAAEPEPETTEVDYPNIS